MVDQEILGGLVSALSRGDSLKKAMMSFYNAGYKKIEIEEAARSLQSNLPAFSEDLKKQFLEESSDKNPPSNQIVSNYEKQITKNQNVMAQKPSNQMQHQQKSNSLQNQSSQKQRLSRNQLRELERLKNNQKISSQYQQQKIFKYPQNKFLNQTQKIIQPSQQNFPQRNLQNSKIKQQVSNYGSLDKEQTELRKVLQETISGLKQMNSPGKPQIFENSPIPIIIQRVSDYDNQNKQNQSYRPVSKALTLFLVFMLILLLGSIVALLFFKSQIIDLFNSF